MKPISKFEFTGKKSDGREISFTICSVFLPGRIGHSYLIKPIQHQELGGMSRIMYGLYSMPFKYMAEFSDSERATASAERREAQRKPTPQLTLQ